MRKLVIFVLLLTHLYTAITEMASPQANVNGILTER